MKVKVFIAPVRTPIVKEIELDDKFRALAIEHPWECDIPDELYAEAIAAVEQAVGVKLDYDEEASYISGVADAETDIIMLEC